MNLKQNTHTLSQSLVMIVALTASVVLAKPTVIYDSGQTQSLSRYQVIVPTPKAVPKFTAQAPHIKFPVKTLELSPGTVQTRRINHPYLDQPFFIIGADKLSLSWLQHHAQQLNAVQATGIIVNVATAQQLQEIRQLVPTLEINPVTGTKLAKQLALHHYPVLISQTRIEQ